MSTLNLFGFIGQTGFLALEGFRFPVRVLDARRCWDRLDFYVEPQVGSGKKWVSADRVTLDEDVGPLSRDAEKESSKTAK